MSDKEISYQVVEIFYSLQGEGWLQGLPMVFIRFSGCNLHCSFCDTRFARTGGKEMRLEEIMEEVSRHGCPRICLTGGEPFRQKLAPLVMALKKAGYWVSAETNGTIWQKVNLDWLTVSPKREGRKFHPAGYDRHFRDKASEFKYVITRGSDFNLIDSNLPCPVILQPVNNSPKAIKLITGFLMRHYDRRYFLRLQLHKVIGLK
ncbi:MAG: 7-carboxy-7-deazaguanine synthase QueE [Candidatus Omnitrophica bacterium]|nr:7-carboxy-7-deazaguanine synthase QueE [Candidatus Omnitrophota bacterium]